MGRSVRRHLLQSFPDLPPRYNVALTQDVPVVRLNPETRERSLDLFRWG